LAAFWALYAATKALISDRETSTAYSWWRTREIAVSLTRKYWLTLASLTSPEVFKIPNENVVIQILSGYKAQSGTVAKSFITPSLSKSSLMSLGMFVIKLCPSLLPTCK